LMEVAYVGNTTRDISSSNMDINKIPLGALLASNNGGVDPNTLTGNVKFRPLPGYGDLNIATNNLHSNYNSLQVTWLRSKGRYTINMNYTYGKAMGNTNGFYDQFNLANNYGVLSSNRTHIFNAAYVIDLGSHTSNKMAGGLINGWQLSGITQLESGPNLSGYQGENFGMNTNSGNIPVPGVDCNASDKAFDPTKCFHVSNASILGTTDVQLQPLITCNPRSGLAAHQFINPNCFAEPTQVGQQGPTMPPPIYGPAYFNSDLGIFKSFRITEADTLQFRFDGFNFLNHPLWSFNGANLALGFDPATYAVNTPGFGTVTQKQGHRVIQMQVRFQF